MEVIGVKLLIDDVAALLRLDDKHSGPNTDLIRSEKCTIFNNVNTATAQTLQYSRYLIYCIRYDAN